MKPLTDDTGRQLYVLLRKSTGAVEKSGVLYPRADGAPIEGLDPDLLWLPMRSMEPAAYDHTYDRASSVGQRNEQEGTYDFVTTLEKRPAEDTLATLNAHADAKIYDSLPSAETRELLV